MLVTVNTVIYIVFQYVLDEAFIDTINFVKFFKADFDLGALGSGHFS